MSDISFNIDQVCKKCGGKMRAKKITINYWLRGTCQNAGVKWSTPAFCPKCDQEPEDHIEYVDGSFDLF